MSDPKIEPWMVEAAREVIEAEDEGHLFRTIRNEMEATEGRRAGTDRDATQRTYEALAAIIARHAPDPASVPIGPGDVVQVETPYTPERHKSGYMVGNYMFSKAEYLTVGSVFKDSFMLHPWEQCEDTIPLSHVVRIERAVYWPDGSKVEEQGK